MPGSMVNPQAGWSTDRTVRTSRRSPAVEPTSSICCRKAPSSSLESKLPPWHTDIKRGDTMPNLSSADHSVSPPEITISRQYNAAYDLLQRNLQAGRADKVAFIDDRGPITYGEIELRSNRFANLLVELGVQREQRVLLCAHDTIDFPTAFLGAIKAGAVPVAVNTLLTAGDYEYMLGDCRAPLAVVSAALLPLFEPLVAKLPTLQRL